MDCEEYKKILKDTKKHTEELIKSKALWGTSTIRCVCVGRKERLWRSVLLKMIMNNIMTNYDSGLAIPNLWG